MAQDLRTFIKQLSHTDTFVRVSTEVDPGFEISAVLRRLEADGKVPAVLFGNVKGSPFGVLSNVFADPAHLAVALGTDRRQVSSEYARRSRTPLASERVDGGPVKELIQTGEDVDLMTLPQIVHSVGDAGAYITSAVTIARDPGTGAYNAGIYRVQMCGPRKLRINPAPGSDLLKIYEQHEARGEALDVALCIGHHPALHLASQHRSPQGVSELDIAGSLLGEPLRMTAAETLGIDVPADAEIVVEARILAAVREEEGPFIELAQFENAGERNPVVEVTAVTRRRDAIYHDIYSAHADHNNVGAPAREADLLARAQAMSPAVTGVALPASGAARFTAYVALHQPKPGLGRSVALQLLGAIPALRLVVLVNSDVDVYDESDVQWAIATRVRADEDVIVLPGLFVTGLDPSAHTIRSRTEHGDINAKWIIDATVQEGGYASQRRDLPRALWEDLDLSKYLPGQR